MGNTKNKKERNKKNKNDIIKNDEIKQVKDKEINKKRISNTNMNETPIGKEELTFENEDIQVAIKDIYSFINNWRIENKQYDKILEYFKKKFNSLQLKEDSLRT
jgi:hypothetical protein